MVFSSPLFLSSSLFIEEINNIEEIEKEGRGKKIKGGFSEMEKTLVMEVNDWWNKFDLVEKILIKDTIINLCDKEISPVRKKKYIEAIRKKLVVKE